MDYCPKCGKRMILLKKKNARTVTLILSCPECRYEKQATRPHWTIKPINSNRRENLIILGKKEQKLRATPTIIRHCPKCKNNKAYAWLVHLGRLEQSSIQFFRCTKCGQTFREIT